MPDLPGWKVRREIARLGQQLRAIPEAVWEPVANRRHDALVARGLPVREGEVGARDKVLLYLVYQPEGLSDTTFATLRDMIGQGYAPVVVSNAPLSARDAGRLRGFTHLAVERPNFGYDFGGYRDGLTVLGQRGLDPDSVLILNDSVWVLPGYGFPGRLEASGADVAGSILRVRGNERFLESYVYRLSRRALGHAAFAAYWAGLGLTSNKYKVIRRGERGFSAAMRAGGLSVAAVHDAEALEGMPQDEAFLAKTLAYAAYVDAPLAAERDALLADRGAADWRARVSAHVDRVLVKRQAYSSFPYAFARIEDYPFLKKSRDPVGTAWRRAWLAGVEAGDIPAPPSVFLKEIRARG
jgi:hypothetical protein